MPTLLDEVLNFAQEVAQKVRLQNEKAKQDVEKIQQEQQETKQQTKQNENIKKDTEKMKQESKQQSLQKTKPKTKQTTQKIATTQQSLEDNLLNLIGNEIKAILTGQKSPQESKLFEDIIKERGRIEKDLQDTIQKYNNKMKEIADFTNKFNDAHNKMIGLFALMLGKSDLARHTNEHLFDKMRELILYYPVDVVPLAMRNLITGYFAGKQAGIDTDGISIGELVAMGENPEFVSKLSPKSLEFLGQLIDVMPQIFQMKVAPYKIELDKLQNEAKILELRQTHLENMHTKLEQNALRRMQLLELLLNYILTAKTRKEVAGISAQAKIETAKIKEQSKAEKEKSKGPLTQEDIEQMMKLLGK